MCNKKKWDSKVFCVSLCLELVHQIHVAIMVYVFKLIQPVLLVTATVSQ